MGHYLDVNKFIVKIQLLRKSLNASLDDEKFIFYI